MDWDDEETVAALLIIEKTDLNQKYAKRKIKSVARKTSTADRAVCQELPRLRPNDLTRKPPWRGGFLMAAKTGECEVLLLLPPLVVSS